ncbi:MAG: hypothetical protein HUU08_15790, partial [Candidatus Brocadia sp.]|nr:hypothetical protein [Candidatus Brocadia sp.]
MSGFVTGVYLRYRRIREDEDEYEDWFGRGPWYSGGGDDRGVDGGYAAGDSNDPDGAGVGA